MSSKEELAAIRHLRAKYPYIVAWGRYIGEDPFITNKYLIQANTQQQPEDVVYAAIQMDDREHTWVRFGNLQNEKLKQYLISNKR